MSRWPKVCLGDVAEIDRETIEPSAIHDGTTYVGLENIESGGKLVGVSKVASGQLESTKFKFSERHVLYGKLRPYLAKIACPTFPGVCSTDILPLLPGAKLDRRYLAYYLLQPDMVSYAASRATGANLPRLSPKALTEFEIPLPSLTEQKRIAAILDAAEALRDKRLKAIECLRRVRHSILNETLRLADAKTDQVRFEDLVLAGRHTFVNGPFGSDLLLRELTNVGVPVIYIRDIAGGEYRRVSAAHVTLAKARELAPFSVTGGDVLIAKVGNPPGAAALYPASERDGVVTQDVVRMRLDENKIVPQFLVSYLNSEHGARRLETITVRATRARFSLRDLKHLTLGLPRLDLQREFAKQVARIDSARRDMEAALLKIGALVASLQQRAFSGSL